jgi:hypothetical protein
MRIGMMTDVYKPYRRGLGFQIRNLIERLRT